MVESEKKTKVNQEIEKKVEEGVKEGVGRRSRRRKKIKNRETNDLIYSRNYWKLFSSINIKSIINIMTNYKSRVTPLRKKTDDIDEKISSG